jgi:hypothetical protein
MPQPGLDELHVRMQNGLTDTAGKLLPLAAAA